MRIMSRKTLEFTNAEGGVFRADPLVICDAPDWVARDPLFGWGVKDESIEVLEAPADVAAVEKANGKKGAPDADPAAGDQTPAK